MRIFAASEQLIQGGERGVREEFRGDASVHYLEKVGL